MTPNSVFKASDSVLLRTAGTETVLLDLDSEEFFGLDGVGAKVFGLLDESRTVGQIVDELLTEYAVDRDTLLADITDLLSVLQAKGLVLYA